MSVTCRSKTASDWNYADIFFFNITLQVQKGTQFLGPLPPTFKFNTDFLVPIDEAIGPHMRKQTMIFLQNLRLAYYGELVTANARNAQLELANMIFQITGYAKYPVAVCRSFDIPFDNCGEMVVSTTDVALYHCEKSMILLVFRIDSAEGEHMHQIIADAIAAFQHNNRKRVEDKRQPLDEMIIPCITMVGTSPIFYRVPVTNQLSEAVVNGKKPSTQTLVTYCLPPLWDGSNSIHIDAPEYRTIVFQYYEVFRGFAMKCWAEILA